MIADGKHEMRLFDLTFCVTSAGTPAASFVWESADGTERTSYVLALTDPTGRPNHFGIQLTRRWARGWDGINLDWFRDNRETLLGTPAFLTVRGGQVEWASPGEVKGQRSEVRQWNLASGASLNGGRGATPRHVDATSSSRQDKDVHLFSDATRTSRPHGFATASQPSTSSRTVHIKLVVDPKKLAELPERIEPNFVEAKALFDAITEGTAKFDADKVWTLIAKKVGPMQIDFGEEEWKQMIDKIKRLKSWSGTVEV